MTEKTVRNLFKHHGPEFVSRVTTLHNTLPNLSVNQIASQVALHYADWGLELDKALSAFNRIRKRRFDPRCVGWEWIDKEHINVDLPEFLQAIDPAMLEPEPSTKTEAFTPASEPAISLAALFTDSVEQNTLAVQSGVKVLERIATSLERAQSQRAENAKVVLQQIQAFIKAADAAARITQKNTAVIVDAISSLSTPKTPLVLGTAIELPERRIPQPTDLKGLEL